MEARGESERERLSDRLISLTNTPGELHLPDDETPPTRVLEEEACSEGHHSHQSQVLHSYNTVLTRYKCLSVCQYEEG